MEAILAEVKHAQGQGAAEIWVGKELMKEAKGIL